MHVYTLLHGLIYHKWIQQGYEDPAMIIIIGVNKNKKKYLQFLKLFVQFCNTSNIYFR